MIPHHRQTLEWAKQNASAVLREIQAYFAQKPYPLHGERDSQTGITVVRVRFAPVAPIPFLEHKVGDVVHNFRVALDHLMYAIALKAGAPEKTLQRVQFPVCETQSGWKDVKKRLAVWCPAQCISLLEIAQPFNSSDGLAGSPFWLLNELDNRHKHRNIIHAAPTFSDIKISNMGGPFAVYSNGPEGEFRDGCVVARYSAGPTGIVDLPGYTEVIANYEMMFEPIGDELPAIIPGFFLAIPRIFELQVFPQLELFT